LRIVVCDSPEAVSRFAADRISQLLVANQQASRSTTLGLATGGTPLGLYRELIQRHKLGALSFQDVSTFNLDEYVGIEPNDPRSYHAYMLENLFRHVDIDLRRTHVPRTHQVDLVESAIQFEKSIAEAGGIDLQVLGIGSDGHIGFNELGSSFASRTRVKSLTHQTRADNARYFSSLDEVPRMALTIGIGTILESRSILLLATGESKARAIRSTVEGPITAMVPSSILQMHSSVTVVIDRHSASHLEHLDYYLDCERNRDAV
jgi:glucosamine-6-phosphate deaminase